MDKLKKFEDFAINESISKGLYWDGAGKHQDRYDQLYKDLVQRQGSSDTLNGELLRAASRLYHENFNNGNCNAREEEWDHCSHCSGSGEVEVDSPYDEDETEYEECPECWGEGKTEEGAQINGFYKKFLDLIEYNVPAAKKEVGTIRDIILSGSGDESAYDRLVDTVVEHIISTEDQPLPAEYDKD